MTDQQTDRDAWWDHACRELVPRALAAATGCDPVCAREIGADIAARGRAFARCGPSARDVLITPFVEEAIHHRPAEAPLSVRSAVVVVVRNSLVEREHALGRLGDADVRSITKVMTELLHAFLVMQPRAREPGWLAGEFAGLPGRYPRAWGAFAALFQTLVRGGGSAAYKVDYRPGPLPSPRLPGPGEISPRPGAAMPGKPASAGPREPGTAGGRPGPGPLAGSGLDPRLGAGLVDRLADLAAGRDEVLAVPSLSRISRRHDNLLRVVEFALAQGGSVLTANYLLRPGMVYVRSGRLAIPDNRNHAASFADQRGLADVHRACAEAALASLADAS
ncbi:recombinase family protein [Pseudofrankia sp. DC12]|uniref:recombinase family protein n=1 Tax=Pseudofrankia sp. DC12 TaxID=683315 RepID=UPI000AAC4955|nr:recombinase family protein [Pseudofrankia sp. DC12]